MTRHCGQLRSLFSIAVLAIGGCTTSVVEYSDGRPLPPKPSAPPTTPESAKATALALMVAPKPIDTDGNRVPDLIKIDAYLFAEPHPTPIHASGTFVFTLYPMRTAPDPNATPIAEWRYGPELLAKHQSAAMAGPCYHFELSLLEHGGEDRVGIGADLAVRFEPAGGGPPIRAMGVRTIQFRSPHDAQEH